MAENSLIDDSMPRIKGVLLQMPENNDFGYCAVNQPTSREFRLTNHTNVEKHFSFDQCPFEIEPQSDYILPKQTKLIRISFTPSDATVIVASTIFKVDGEKTESGHSERIIKFSAIGKFPFLKTLSNKIDFEEVIYGKKKVKNLIINNASEVTTRFTIRKLMFDEYDDNSFTLDSNGDEIPPKSSFLVKIMYKPMIWDLYSCSHFEIKCEGGNKIEVQCEGRALSVDARLSSRLVNFGSIKLGTVTNRSVTLHNYSDSNCVYEVVIDNSGVFSVQNGTGVIKPKAYARLLFFFNPQKTINYYQRVYILIRSHLALHIDLMGNCYDLLIKPPAMSPAVFKETRLQLGFGGIPLISSATKINGEDAEDHPVEDLESSRQIVANSNQIHKELFGGHDLAEKFIVCDTKFLDFAYGDNTGPISTREVVLENVTGRKLSMFWTNDSPYFGSKDNVFDVHPPVSHVNAGHSAKFTIAFRPNKAGAFYFERLQCFAIDYDTNVMEKINKASFAVKKRMIEKSNINASKLENELNVARQIPPIETGIICTGNSFSPDTQPFIPMIEVAPRRELVFSPCAIGETAYTSIQLLNKTDTPSYFKFDSDGQKTFDVFPKSGLIEGNKFRIIFFKFNPTEPNLYQKIFHCRLNNAIDVVRIKLTGYCCKPTLEISNNSQVFFPPAFLGVHSKQKIAVHNKSRVPLSYNIVIPEKYKDELIFSPERAMLLPNQTDFVTVSLMPLKKKKYQIRVPIDVYGDGSDKIVENQQIEVYGEGGDGSLVVKPELVDFGIIKVNFQKIEKITIYNHSHVTFYLSLEIRPFDDNVKMDEVTKRIIQNSFHLDFSEGIVTSHSKIEVTITFKPVEICELKVKLVCVAKEKPPLGIIVPTNNSGIVEKCSVELRANGRFPILKIIDVRNEDMSVSTLWDNFRLDNINKELLEKTQGKNEVKDFENLATYSDRDDVIERNYHEWNFGYLQNKTVIEPRRIILTVQNVGGTDLDWKFKFPNDNQINAEPWADPGEQSEKEAYERMILEKRIFQVYPKSGNLKPNEKQSIELHYSPNMDEEIYDKKGNKEPTQDHKLRVILHVENGKSLKVLFRGKTLAHLQAQLAFSKEVYTLPSLPIGMIVPVTIPIQMENVGSGNITHCEVEESEIIRANQDNGAAKVFDIENRITKFAANEKKPMFVQFKPAEAKEYNFVIHVKSFDFVRELETKRIQLRGWGFDKDHPAKQITPPTEIPMFKCSSDELSPQAFFSIEELDFGEVTPQETVSRMFIIFNQSTLSRLKFEFEKPRFICKDTLSVSPSSSLLNPGEYAEIKLTLVGSIHPSIYEGELECKAMWIDIDKQNRNIEDQRLVKQSTKNEGSSMPTPKSSVDKAKYKQELKYECKMETLFLRMKKRSKITVAEQRESLRTMITKSKDFKEYTEGESIYNNIFSRLIKDVLSSEYATNLVQDIVGQAPRLYCFFDKDDPVSVNDPRGEEEPVEDINGPEEQYQNEEQDDRQQSPDSRPQSTRKFDEPNNTADVLRRDVSMDVRQANETSALNQSFKDRPSQNNTIKGGFDELSRGKHIPVPDHIGPQDVIKEEEQGEEDGEGHVRGRGDYESKEQRNHQHEIDQIMVRDEFKMAAQTVFDDIFMQMVRDSVNGRSNLNEKLMRSNTRVGNKPIARLRTQKSIYNHKQ